MTALKIEEIRTFTSKLFVGEIFDQFLAKEAVIATFNTFTIDGTIRTAYYSKDEQEEMNLGQLSTWAMMKPFCFSLIKGKRLPVSFRIILQMSKEGTERFLASRQIPLAPDQVKGLYLNIRYEEQRLVCVTGTSVRMFTLDKTLEQQWDAAAETFIGAQRSL